MTTTIDSKSGTILSKSGHGHWTRPVRLLALFGTFCFAGASFAADQQSGAECAAIKQSVTDNRSYVYNYKDAAHPSLQLYDRYVRSGSQCAADEVVIDHLVPSLIGCDVPACEMVED